MLDNSHLETNKDRLEINNKIIFKLKEMISDPEAQFIGEFIKDDMISYMVNSNKGITFINVRFVMFLGNPVIVEIEDLTRNSEE